MMNCFEVKKVIPASKTLSIEEGERLLISENFCLGVFDQNSEIFGYLTKEDFDRVSEFNIKNQPISLITTLSDFVDTNIDNPYESEILNHLKSGLNNGILTGKDRKNIKTLIINKDFYNKSENIYLTEEFNKNIPEKTRKALLLCSNAANKMSLPIFLIGGVVRDIIIGKESVDVDITVQGNAIEFSGFLKKQYPEICTVKGIHQDFKTAKVAFFIDNDTVELDIASTRKEKYPYPASLPIIKETGCNINEDIERRDFTINSMALVLNQSDFCKLIDPLGGYEDIKDKKITILHPVSFVDDPTRIIRALKFSIRFGYELDYKTVFLRDNCLNSGLFDNLCGERIKSELKQTLNLNRPECLSRLVKENIYYLIDKNIEIKDDIENLSQACHKAVSENLNYISSKDLIWLVYLGSLLSNFSSDKITSVAQKLYLSGLETEILLGGKTIIEKNTELITAKTRYDIYESLEGYFIESILIGLICSKNEVASENIKLYIKELQSIKIYTTGKALIDAGLKPGPLFGEILSELLKEKINQNISTKEEEEILIKKHLLY